MYQAYATNRSLTSLLQSNFRLGGWVNIIDKIKIILMSESYIQCLLHILKDAICYERML